MKPSGIGGQAVIEGVMMKNKDDYAVAVRKPDGEIEIKKDVFKPGFGGEALRRIPFVRGTFNLIDSLVLGIKTLTFSASFYEEDEEPGKFEKWLTKVFGDKLEKILMTFTVVLSVVISLGLFAVFPAWVGGMLSKVIKIKPLVSLIEGIFRIVLLIAYMLLISKTEDIKRLFMYHGAEHKCINCIEHGKELNVSNVMTSSRYHKRCGTSFILIVMLISVLLFIAVPTSTMWGRILSRILLIPVIAGISYEFLRLAGKTENKLIDTLSKPGLYLQRITTKEPDEKMVEVAMSSVNAVFDWREFLGQSDCLSSGKKERN